MREFIRHPSDIPIHVDFNKLTKDSQPEHLRDISYGGLSFQSSKELKAGTIIQLSIPVINPKFQALGEVVWCRKDKNDYIIGVRFQDDTTNFKIRMVEQVCHIEQYKQKVLRNEGRIITSEQAAMEWIEKYAADFPR